MASLERPTPEDSSRAKCPRMSSVPGGCSESRTQFIVKSMRRIPSTASSSFTALLFSLALPLLACGGDDGTGADTGASDRPDTRGSSNRDDAASVDDDATVDEDIDEVNDADAGGPDLDAGPCETGERVCSGQSVLACDNEGAWVLAEICEQGCNAGNCVDPCEVGKTYLGCSFVAVDLDNSPIGVGGSSADAEQFAITLANPGTQPALASIRTGAGAEVQTGIVVGPGELTRIPLPRADVDNSERSRDVYFVDVDRPVTAHQFNPLNNANVYSNDASLLLPRGTLGRSYVVTNWTTEVQQVPIEGPRPFRTFVTIVATSEGATDLTIDLAARAAVAAGDGVDAAQGPGRLTYTLQQGEVLSLSSTETDGVDFSGTRIDGSQTFAVFVGAECANVPHGNPYCDHLEEQLIPYEGWGTEYVLAAFARRGREPAVYRIVANAPITLQTEPAGIAGVDGVAMAPGETVEVMTDESFLVRAEFPFAVGQFMVGSAFPGPANGCTRDPDNINPMACAIPTDARCGNSSTGSAIGDPAFLMLTPQSRLLNDYIVLTPAEYHQDWLTAVHVAGETLTLDGSPVVATPTPLGATGLAITRIEVADGVHRVSAASGFALYAYGYDCDVSYAYAAGFDLGQ